MEGREGEGEVMTGAGAEMKPGIKGREGGEEKMRRMGNQEHMMGDGMRRGETET